MAKGILIAAMDFSDVAEDEFHDWYDMEHIPERLGVPGFINAERWIGSANPIETNVRNLAFNNGPPGSNNVNIANTGSLTIAWSALGRDAPAVGAKELALDLATSPASLAALLADADAAQHPESA